MSVERIVDPEDTRLTITEEPQDLPPAKDADDGLPDKFKGKSAKEIADAYKNLESELGRSRNELGTVRRLADELLDFRRAEPAKPTVPAKPVTGDQLLDDPEETIVTIARREAAKEIAAANARTEKLEASMAMQGFEKKYPDYMTTMADDSFRGWVTKSNLRQQLAAAAAKGDVNAADELFGLYEDVKGSRVPQKAEIEEPKTGVEAAKAASLSRSGGSVAGGVVPGGDGGKKIYKRSELIDLRINNPEEYDRRYETEFHKAYKEGRVR